MQKYATLDGTFFVAIKRWRTVLSSQACRAKICPAVVKDLGLVHRNSIRAVSSRIRIQTNSGFCPVFVAAMRAVVVAKSGEVALAYARTTWLKSLLLVLLFVVVLAAGAVAVAAALRHDLSGHLNPAEKKTLKC